MQNLTPQEFLKEVQKVTSHDDFTINNNIAFQVRIDLREVFITCLKLGGKIKASFDCLQMLENIARKTHLTPFEAIVLTLEYRQLISILDNQK